MTHPVNRFLEKASELSAIALAFFIPLSTSLTDILFIVSVALGLLTQRFRHSFPVLVNNPWVKVAIFLFALFAISISYTSASLLEAILVLGKYSHLLLMVLLIPTFINAACRKYAIYAFLGAMIITLFLAYLQLFGFSPLPQKYGQAAIFKDRIQTNFLMAFAFYLFSWQLLDLLINYTKNTLPHFKIFWISLILLCTLMAYDILFLSDGRSGYIIFSLLSLLLAWQKFKGRGVVYALAGILFIMPCVFMLSKNFHDRMLLVQHNVTSYQVGSKDTSVGLRLSFATNSMKLIAKHPFVGTGTGSFKNEYMKITPTPSRLTENPHNEYLNIGIQLGLPAVMMLLLLFYLQWRDSQNLSTPYKEIVQAVIAAISVGCLANSWLMDTTEGHFYAFFIALCFAAEQMGPERASHARSELKTPFRASNEQQYGIQPPRK